jgi:hypothetical protein
MRRGNPERIYQAKLAGLRARMVRQWHQSDDRADEFLAEWEEEASARGLDRREAGYWNDAARWIEKRIARK